MIITGKRAMLVINQWFNFKVPINNINNLIKRMIVKVQPPSSIAGNYSNIFLELALL